MHQRAIKAIPPSNSVSPRLVNPTPPEGPVHTTEAGTPT